MTTTRIAPNATPKLTKALPRTLSMRRPYIAAFALGALGVMTACSGASEGPGASGGRAEVDQSMASLSPDGKIVIPDLSNVHVSVDGSSVTITYTRSRLVRTPYSVRLTGPSGATTRPEGSIDGATGVQFTGLDECTGYDWTILSASGANLESGVVHTLTTGDATCPTSENLAPTSADDFHGVFHDHSGAVWCEDVNWNPDYVDFPLGTGWRTHIYPTYSAPPPYGGFGYFHFWNPGSKPFPCWEQVVDVDRTRYDWEIEAAKARRIRSATLEVTYGLAVCSSSFMLVGLQTWPITTAQTDAQAEDGETWADVLGGPVNQALGEDGPGIRLSIKGLSGSADVTSQAKTGRVTGGFIADDDGYPEYTAQPGIDYAKDNNSCSSGSLDLAVATTYAPLTPDTPLNCTVQLTCTSYTVTCDPAPELFELWGPGYDGEGPFDYAQGTTTTGPSFAGDYPLSGNIHVCSVDATGKLRTCTAPLPLPTLDCKTPPPPPPPRTCGGVPTPVTSACDVGWHCCSDKWHCGLCD